MEASILYELKLLESGFPQLWMISFRLTKNNSFQQEFRLKQHLNVLLNIIFFCCFNTKVQITLKKMLFHPLIQTTCCNVV
jgi:hypothetical protein